MSGTADRYPMCERMHRVTSESGYVWAQDLPPGCPSPEATPAHGTFYRFVRTNPFTAADFQRPIDTPRYRKEEHRGNCALYALSVYSLIDDARRARELIPSMSKRLIAGADLMPEHGVVSNSPDKHPSETLWSHHDWWVPVRIMPSSLFTVVPE
jgi:hypothetical protein